MKFEIEKLKDNTYTVRIKVNGKVTFSNNGMNSKQGAYKKIIGLYRGIAHDLDLDETGFYKTPNKPEIWVAYTGNVRRSICIDVKEINC